MNVRINNDWDILLKDEFTKKYFQELSKFIDDEYQTNNIFPTKENIFTALKLTSFKNTKVVIVGQDPYHEEGQAHGLAFSVLDNVKIPPSLKNIYKELSNDLEISMPISGNLTKWANEGVLLINSVLTVRESLANSHKNKGWEIFTNRIIEILNEKKTTVVFILWGRDAINKEKLITNKNHVILTAPHPSPLSAYQGFFGCKHFSKTNQILKQTNQKQIDWSL